ncbi:hypothetical protein [Streptomyces werraensis]|uniref:hypothetical protein n=1 Tax=Streptomyces werraensis TaxID=68284 RepID=UPI001CE35AA9
MSGMPGVPPVGNLHTEYVPALRALVSRLTGDVGVHEVRTWRRGLRKAIVSATRADGLCLLVDTHGYQPRGVDVQRELHQALVGELPAGTWRAVIFLHHDGAKMSLLDAAAEDGVRYLSDRGEAVSLLCRAACDGQDPDLGV